MIKPPDFPKYRTGDAKGQMSGGPMYYIKNGLGKKRYSGVLSTLFAILGKCSTFLNRNLFAGKCLVDSARIAFDIPEALSAAVISLFVTFCDSFGWIRRIASRIPVSGALYGNRLYAQLPHDCRLNLEKLTETLILIINSAFTGTAARAVFLEQG